MLRGEQCDRAYQRLDRIVRELVQHLAQQLARAAQREVSKEETAKIASFGPLELITFLKQEFAGLLAVRMQVNADKSTQSSQVQEYQRTIQQLEVALSSSQALETDLQSHISALQRELTEVSAARDQLAISSKQALDLLKADNGSLLELVRNREGSVEDLKMQIDSLRQLVASQEEQMERIPMMEEQIKDFTRRYATDMGRSEAKYKNDLQKSDKELKAHKKTLAVNTQYEEKIKQLGLELESFRRKFRKQIDSEQRAIRLAEIAADRNNTIQKLEIECNRLKVQLEARSQETERLRKNLEAANRQVDEMREKPREPTKEEIRTEAVDNNPLRVDYYRKKVKEKKVEILQLQRRLQNMYDSEKRHKRNEEKFTNERVHYADRIASLARTEGSLRQQLAACKPEDPYAIKKDGVAISDYENVRELAKSTSDAYTGLLEKFKKMKSEEEERGLMSGRVSVGTFKSTRPTTADVTGRKPLRGVSARGVRGSTTGFDSHF